MLARATTSCIVGLVFAITEAAVAGTQAPPQNPRAAAAFEEVIIDEAIGDFLFERADVSTLAPGVGIEGMGGLAYVFYQTAAGARISVSIQWFEDQLALRDYVGTALERQATFERRWVGDSVVWTSGGAAWVWVDDRHFLVTAAGPEMPESFLAAYTDRIPGRDRSGASDDVVFSDPARYELVRIVEVAGRAGVAADDGNYYVAGTDSILVYDTDGAELRANRAPFGELERRANRIDDISVHDGELYVGVAWHQDGQASDARIAVYDAATLAYTRTIEWTPARTGRDDGEMAIGALTVDSDNGCIWVSERTDAARLHRIPLGDGGVSTLRLRPAPQRPRGIVVHGGSLHLVADDGDAGRDEADNMWRVSIDDPAATATYVTHELAFDQLRDFGDVAGVDVDGATGEIVVLSNRGARIIDGAPAGFHPGYERAFSELHIFGIVDVPSGSADDGE